MNIVLSDIFAWSLASALPLAPNRGRASALPCKAAPFQDPVPEGKQSSVLRSAHVLNELLRSWVGNQRSAEPIM